MDIEDLQLTADESLFRDQVRRFYERNLTDSLRRAAQLTTWTFAEFEYGRQWQQLHSDLGLQQRHRVHRLGWLVG